MTSKHLEGSKIRWGILGTGKISRKFARALDFVPNAQLVAVGSRNLDSARAFAGEFADARVYGSYQALVDDSEVDAVYVGTPHILHYENTMMALAAGKAVLCEKPLALNALQARQMIDLARARNLFLMEAMWMRFFPLVERLRHILRDGTIGESRMLAADFGFKGQFGPEHRLFNPELGGGALLDVGIYPISLASMLWGSPERVASLAHIGLTGVDDQAGILFGYPDGKIAVLYTSSRVDTPIEAVVMGTRGRVKLHRRMHQPTMMTVIVDGEEEQRFEAPLEGNGLNYEAEEVVRCLREGLTESPIMPLDESLAIMETLDQLRATWGLRYPGE